MLEVDQLLSSAVHNYDNLRILPSTPPNIKQWSEKLRAVTRGPHLLLSLDFIRFLQFCDVDIDRAEPCSGQLAGLIRRNDRLRVKEGRFSGLLAIGIHLRNNPAR